MGEVIVSAGGGAVGEALLRTALAARRLTALAGAPWRLLVGPNLPQGLLAELQAAAPPGVVVEPARPDFIQLIARCRLSISQAGYNTLMELMALGTRAVVVPFAAAAETEQTLRAELIAAKGLIEVVREDMLAPEALAAAADRALARPADAKLVLNLSGLATSVELIRQAVTEAR
ncbi:MAG: hypothetical protein HYR63_06835 [Proteobacteria bacterium]|nr:hypothetical protein [Pseudomonadota bacterium]